LPPGMRSEVISNEKEQVLNRARGQTG